MAGGRCRACNVLSPSIVGPKNSHDHMEMKVIEYIKFLVDRVDRQAAQENKAAYIKTLIRSEALDNLDILRMLENKKLKGNHQEIRKAIKCLRSNASELMISLGVRPEDVMDGDLPPLEQGLLDDPQVDGNRLDSLNDFDRQSDLWLFTFADRKIRQLVALANNDFDLSLLGLTKRLRKV